MILRPKKQGSFDGACGFYAVHNAVTAICPKLIDDNDFSILLNALSKDGSIPRQYFAGTGRNEVSKMLKTMLDDQRFADVKVERIFWRRKVALGEFWSRIVRHVNQQHGVAIVGFNYEPGLNQHWAHWSVVKEATPKSFSMFDSEGMKQIRRSSSRAWDDRVYHTSRPYCFDTTSTFLLSTP